MNFFEPKKFTDEGRPILAGLNYFLTHEARGGSGKGLLGEKRDVRVWLSWLERYAHGDVRAIETPIGFLPLYEDLKSLFAELIDKDYPRELYDMQFSLYIDKLVGRIDLQTEAFRKDQNIPPLLFEIYDRQKKDLLALREKHGPVVPPATLIEEAGGAR